MSDPLTLVELVNGQGARNPDAVAIAAPGRRPLGYGGLGRHVANVVETLNRLGIGRNDRVAMILPDGPEAAVAFLSLAAGATCAPLNPDYRAAELDAHLAQLGCRALLVPAGSESAAVSVARARGIPIIELVPTAGADAGLFTLRGEPGRCARPGFAEPGDIALVLHTSGTSARPKVVPLTHRNLCASAQDIRAAVELTAADRCLSVMPLFHIHGLSTIYASLAAGASVACAGEFSAARFFEWTKECRPTWYSAVPTLHREILEHARRHPDAVAGSSLRFIRSASAAMPRRLTEEMERVFGIPFVEAYGMSEAGPQIASNRLPPGVRKPGSVGRAAGPEIAIMDDAGSILPPDSEGEVVVRGPNVIAAYGNNPEADREAFAEGWLRTGDRGRLDADGHLFITGRLKEIINRGGEKISPREVDEVLLEHPSVAEAVTFPVPHATLGEDVAAAIVLRPGRAAPAPELRRFAGARLAHFKVPQLVVIVDRIPRGPTGKVRRMELAESLGLLTPAYRPVAFTAARTPLEERLSDIWADVLDVDRPGVHDNFFQTGGDSLKAAQVCARVAGDFHVELPAHALFDSPTVAELAELVTRHQSEEPAGRSRAIPRRNPAEPCPLSFGQQRLWLVDQIEPGNPAYNMHFARRLSGKLSLESLERSLGEIVRRHETLRTTVRIVGGTPVQVVAPVRPVRLPVVDLTRLPESEREAEAVRLASEEAVRPFHLAHGPLFRVALLTLGAEEHVLLTTLHHIVSDGWSTAVFDRELDALYAAYAAGRPSPLPELPVQYGDFSVWQREWLSGERLERQLAYWIRALDGMPPVLELPRDRARPAARSMRGASHAMEIPAALTRALRALGGDQGATAYMTLLAALQTLLHRYTGQTDFGVGTPIANRTRVETERMIGFFANSLVMRADLSDDPTFRETLARVRSTAIQAYAHQDLPFERLVEELHPERNQSINPLFQVMFAFQNLPDTASRESLPGLTASPMELPVGSAKFDLTLYISEAGEGLSASWHYDTDLFDEDRIRRMAGNFRTLLEGIVAAPDGRISSLPLLSDGERVTLLTAWNRTELTHCQECSFPRLFEQQVQATPDAPAVRCGEVQLTYGELNRRANGLARRLQGMGVGPESPVGILVSRSVDMVVAMLGVMKAGGACVPLDPAYPEEHLAFMRQDAGVTVLVTDEMMHGADAESERNPVTGVTPSSLAYVIYTSGSTGKPKGVMITHANLGHYLHAMKSALDIQPGDCWLHTASFGFSSSVRQIALPLSCGAGVVVAETETIRDPLALFELIRERGVSVIDLVPSYWRICRQVLAGLPSERRAGLLAGRLRLILSASEPLPSDVAREVAEMFPAAVRLINMFGQTETAGIVTAYPVPPQTDESPAVVPLGRPIANTRAYVLDPARQPVPIGVWGELYIGGAGVGRGYLNEPELTAEAFVPDPFGGNSGARLYRTGDMTRWRPDGNLEFSGRADHRMKVRGHRIEPAQIEAAVAQHLGWRESAVVTREDAAGEQRLVAYAVPNGSGPSSTRELREFLRRKLPDYMIPSRIVEMAALPRTPNGKVDRAALNGGVHPEPEGEERAPVTGAEEILTAVWTEVLGVDGVSLDDNFFDIGGNSILAIRMIDRATRAGLSLVPRQLWRYPTIGELAAVAEGRDVQGGQDGQDEARVRVTLESLRAYGREALERAGLPPEGAAIVTDVQLEASLRDQPTHNMVSIPRYAQRLARGTINPRPDIRIERTSDTSARIDGDNGPGQWIAVLAMETAMRIAREKGVGIVGVRGSNHLGAAGHYPWMAAREGLVGLCTTNGPVILAPTGGITPTYGNNPLAVGIPARRYHPILLDIAMSVAPRGRIGLKLAEGMALPPGWILDRDGNPSTDPADLVAGLGVPIGGHKGYGLTLIMEVLAGVLTGANFGWDNRRDHGRNEKAAGFGHFFMAIDPELFMPLTEFTARVDRLIEQTKTGERAAGVTEILIPGEAELEAREKSLVEGVPLRPSTYEALRKYGRNAGLVTELMLSNDVSPRITAEARRQP